MGWDMNPIPKRRWVLLRHLNVETAPEPALPLRPLPEHLDFSVALVDKPAGPTSHDVVERVKRMLGASKAGHGGTLDPKVTGVLPVFLGRATRVSSLLLKAGKAYEAVARFHGDISEEAFEALKTRFTGAIEQMPPVRSRVKRQLRTRHVHAIEVLDMSRRDVRFRCDVQAGTYIRKLVHDMGDVHGTGAHMAWLRRTRAGIFPDEATLSLEGLESVLAGARDGSENAFRRAVVPAEVLADLLPRLVIDEGAARAVAGGFRLAAPGILRMEVPFSAGDELAVLDEEGEWVALARALVDGSSISPGGKGFVAHAHRVLRLPPQTPA